MLREQEAQLQQIRRHSTLEIVVLEHHLRVWQLLRLIVGCTGLECHRTLRKCHKFEIAARTGDHSVRVQPSTLERFLNHGRQTFR